MWSASAPCHRAIDLPLHKTTRLRDIRPSHIRLAKRVAEQLHCSRSTAEQFIEGGFVSVDGQVVEKPPARACARIRSSP